MYNYSYAAEKAWDNLYDSDFKPYEGYEREEDVDGEDDYDFDNEADEAYDKQREEEL